MLYQLMYFSLSNEKNNERDIEEIVSLATKTNKLFGISGFLSFNGIEFLQFLEGPETAVHRLMGNIENDRRHHSVIVLTTGRVDHRCFPEWSMQRIELCDVGKSSAPNPTPQTLQYVLSRLDPPFHAAYQRYLER